MCRISRKYDVTLIIAFKQEKINSVSTENENYSESDENTSVKV